MGTPAGLLFGIVAAFVIGFLVWIIAGLWMWSSARGVELANTVARVLIVVGTLLGAVIGGVTPLIDD